MKKGICLCLLIIYYHAAPAQIIIALIFGDKLNTDKLEFGLIAIPALASISGMHYKSRTVYDLGLYLNMKINERLFFHPEAIAKSSFGAKGIPPYNTGNDSLNAMFSGGTVEKNIKGLGLLLFLRYRIKGLLFAEAGPQVDLLRKPKDTFKATVNGNDLTYIIPVNEQVTRFDMGIAGGLIYKLKKDKGMGLGIRYYYGLTDILKLVSGSQRNNVLQLNITIPVGSEKKNVSLENH